MQLIDGRPVFSATDLVGFLACDHLPELELAGLARLVHRPVRPDPELDLIQQRGQQHEERYLAHLQAEGRRVTRIDRDAAVEDRGERLRQAAAETEAAMRRGDDVIYQASFFDGRWLGYADFLEKVETPSALAGAPTTTSRSLPASRRASAGPLRPATSPRDAVSPPYSSRSSRLWTRRARRSSSAFTSRRASRLRADRYARRSTSWSSRAALKTAASSPTEGFFLYQRSTHALPPWTPTSTPSTSVSTSSSPSTTCWSPA